MKLKLWINKKILKIIRDKDKILKKYIKAKNSLLYNRYKNLEKQVKETIGKSKKSYLINFFQENTRYSK